jgi:hypothetical protein
VDSTGAAEMADEGERMPVKLVQENGDTISLDATSIDIVVERVQSNFGIPFFDAKRMGIDLNQSQVAVEINGVFTDDLGQEATSKATATIDLFQPQQVVNWGQPLNSGGGTPTFGITSSFNSGSASSGLTATGFTGGFSGGFGGSSGTIPTDFTDFGNRILRYWNKRYIDFPLAYWVEASGELGIPVTNGLQLHLKSDSLASTLSHNDEVSTWADSSGNGRNATQSSASVKPKYVRLSEFDTAVRFDGLNDFMSIANSPFLNSEEFTLIVACKNNAGSGNQPVISSSDETDSGYSLVMDRSNTKCTFKWEGTSSNTLDSNSAVTMIGDKHILSVRIHDTNANAQSDRATFFIDGLSTQDTSTNFTPEDTSAFNIGKDASDFFKGDIYEIAFYNRNLDALELEKVEGYLARKHGIKIRESEHDYYESDSYNYDTKHIRVAFDKNMVASYSEPYGFINKRRIIPGMGIIDFGSGGTDKQEIIVDGVNPQDYFEITESEREYRVLFRSLDGPWRKVNGEIYAGIVKTITDNGDGTYSFTIDYVNKYGSAEPHDVGDEIYIDAVDYGVANLFSTELTPVLIIPIKNADTFDEEAAPEKAVGPEFPDHENTAPRDTGGGITRTDEYLTYLLSKALTADYIDMGRPVDANNNQTMANAFTAAISNSASNHASRLTLTQKHASSLGSLSDTINTNLGVGQIPVIQGFSGGRSGKKVKSAGDKVQDLLGILANSNNFTSNPQINLATDILQLGADFVNNVIGYDSGGDYIRGIQIPYDSLTTKGKNSLDAEVAQRNFFLTTEGSTSDKLSSANDVHASRSFSHSSEGYLKNGISGIVTDFTIKRDAAMKAYEFSLKFIASDIIL